MKTIIEVEFLAKKFHNETGLTAPFKDVGAAIAADPESNYELRKAEWNKWILTRQLHYLQSTGQLEDHTKDDAEYDWKRDYLAEQ